MTPYTATLRALPALVLALALLSACSQTPAPGGQDAGPVEAPERPVRLSADDLSTSFELENTAAEALDWTIEVADSSDNPQGGAWFDIDPRQGRLEPGERSLVTLTMRGGLAAGDYRSILTVRYRGGETVFEVVGQVTSDGSGSGEGTIGGRVRTANAEIAIEAPSSFGASSSADGAGYAWTRSAAADSPSRPSYLPDQLIVALESGVDSLSPGEESAAFALARRHGLTLIRQDPVTSTALITLPQGADPRAVAAELEADPAVSYAEPNYLFFPHAVPGDPLIDDAWQLPVMGAPVAWEALADLGSRPIVAVIDSGIDLEHEDLSGIFVSQGYDVCASRDCGARDRNPRPDSRADTHGTHVTGLLAAVAGNGRGTAGVLAQGARVLPVKVFHDGATTAAALAEAIRWAAGEPVAGVSNPNPASIITLSLGASSDSETVRRAVESAQERGALIVASAGNDGARGVDYPARYSGVLGVGSVNTNFRRSCFSDYGTGLDLMAPGGDGYLCAADRDEALQSTWPGNDYGIDAGTSMAAPLAAGAAALVWAHLPTADAELVSARLQESAYFDGGWMDSERYGAGIVRIDAALGFPGPGDRATVQAVGPASALATVVLDRFGTSSEFRLENLPPGRYTVEAEAAGRSRSLSGGETVLLAEDGDSRSLTIPLSR